MKIFSSLIVTAAVMLICPAMTKWIPPDCEEASCSAGQAVVGYILADGSFTTLCPSENELDTYQQGCVRANDQRYVVVSVDHTGVYGGDIEVSPISDRASTYWALGYALQLADVQRPQGTATLVVTNNSDFDIGLQMSGPTGMYQCDMPARGDVCTLDFDGSVKQRLTVSGSNGAYTDVTYDPSMSHQQHCTVESDGSKSFTFGC